MNQHSLTYASLGVAALCLVGSCLLAGDPTDAEMRIVQRMDEIGANPIDINRAPGVEYGLPIRPTKADLDFARGEIQIVEDDLVYEGLVPWGHRRTYSNLRWPTYNLHAGRWMLTQSAQLRQVGSDGKRFLVTSASGSGVQFRWDDTVTKYLPVYGNVESLVPEGTLGQGIWFFTDSSGYRSAFRAVAINTTTSLLREYRDPAGNTIYMTWDENHAVPRLLRVWQSVAGGASNTDMEISYTYNSDGFVATAIMKVKRSGTLQTVRKVAYDYYPASNVTRGGGSINLRLVTTKDAADQIIGQSYYTYWGPTSAGFVGGVSTVAVYGMLRHVVTPRTFKRLSDLHGTNPDAWDLQTVLDAKADRVLTYDWRGTVVPEMKMRVITQTVRGESAPDAIGVWRMTYDENLNWYGSMTFEPNGSPSYPDVWKEKIQVERLDSDTGTVLNRRWIYTNWADQVLLDCTQEPTGSSPKKWIHFYAYNTKGQRVLHATPSAVTGWDDQTYLDLIGKRRRDDWSVVQANAAFLKDSDGLIESWTYYTTTTASTSANGGVVGLLEHSRIQKGEILTSASSQGPFLQNTTTYRLRDGVFGTVTERISVPAVETVYVNQSTTSPGARATTKAYTWLNSTLRYSRLTTSSPTVTTANNGSGAAIVDTQEFNAWGHPTWRKDPDGYLHYNAYDLLTGAVTKAIADVDHTKTADFAGLPSGWTKPADGGLHLVTTRTVDNLGRPLTFTDAMGLVSYYFYNDISKEYRLYPAWNAPAVGAPLVSANLLRPPFQVRRDYWGGNWREAVAVKVTGTSTTPPTGTESFTGADVVSLVREQLDAHGHVTTSRAYRSVPTSALPTTFNFGSASDYEETVTTFDNRGRPTRVKDPAGTSTWTDYDLLSRPNATHTGSADTQYQVGSTTYDGGGVGNGNVTSTSALSGSQTLVTSYGYDWRDRLTSKTGPDFIKTVLTRDNLGRITTQQVYRSNATDSAEASADSSNLGTVKQVFFDEAGRVYKASTTPYDAAGVAQTPTVLRYWYDHRGNLVKIAETGGLLRKAAFDGLGRRWRLSLSLDAAETSYADSKTLTGDSVIEQTDTWYTLAGDLVGQVEYKRKDTGTTPNGPLLSTSAYATAQIWWFDAAHRQVASANFGRDDASTRYVLKTDGTINLHATLKIPAEAAGTPRAPDASDQWQATRTVYAYTSDGELVTTITDNAGRISVITHDRLGRKIKEVQAKDDGAP